MSMALSLPRGPHPGPGLDSLHAGGMTDAYLKALFFTLPMTSFLALPFVQGTTPANLLLLLLLFPLSGPLLLGLSGYGRLVAGLLPFVLGLAVLFVASRYSLLYASQGLGGLSLTNPRFILPLTMTANVTQSIYLIVGLTLLFLLSRHYDRAWDGAIFAGAWFLLAYGMADWAAQTFAGLNVDLLSNRTFEVGRYEMPGSLRQTLPIAGLPMLRFKSFTGEPSMYCLTALCYLALAIARDRRWLAGALVVSILLSFSATGYLGLIAFAAFFVRRAPFAWVASAIGLFIGGLAVVIWVDGDALWQSIDHLFLSKLAAESHSGSARLTSFLRHLEAWWGSPLTVLVGYGFGTARSTDFLSTLLVNLGLIGTLAVFALFGRLLLRARRCSEAVLPAGLVAVFILMLVAVPEFAYLPPWLLAGIALRESGHRTA